MRSLSELKKLRKELEKEWVETQDDLRLLEYDLEELDEEIEKMENSW